MSTGKVSSDGPKGVRVPYEQGCGWKVKSILGMLAARCAGLV